MIGLTGLLTLAQVYHRVFKALDATPERAKAEVVEKWRTGQLLLYCEHKEYRPNDRTSIWPSANNPLRSSRKLS